MVTLRILIDFDGTLTAEEEQAGPLAERSLGTLAGEILHVPRAALADRYASTRARLLAAPHLHHWEVNGLVASYCDEGAFILNTTTLQTLLADLLAEDPALATTLRAALPHPEYDVVADATNYLFHRHTAALPPLFRPGARDLLQSLAAHKGWEPVVLTNSLGDKVTRLLGTLALSAPPAVLGDTRQYEMAADWRPPFLPDRAASWLWHVDALHTVDLRRPAYYRALAATANDMSGLVVVGDTLSLPGALPLAMGIPFCLLHTPYTPEWCLRAVRAHPLGTVLENLCELPDALSRFA